MPESHSPLAPKGIWIPYYRKNLSPLLKGAYNFFFLGSGYSLLSLWTWFAGLALLGAGYLTWPLALMGVLGAGYLPHLLPGWFLTAFPYLAWATFILGLFAIFFTEDGSFRSLEAHQRWRIRRAEYWLTGTLTMLWGWAWLQGGFEEFRGKMLYLDSLMSYPLYGWGAVALGALRLLAVAVWTRAIEYRYEDVVARNEGGEGGLPSGEDVGLAKAGKVDPKEAARDPSPTARQALLWELRQNLVLPPQAEEEVVDLILLLRHHEAYRRRFGSDIPRGVLLVGPPGTGKTSIARFIAEKSGLSFVAATPGELRSKWLGESAKLIARLFAKARNLAPVVVFIDELDAVAPRRGGHDEVNHLVGQLLQELDGIRADTAKAPVVFIGASNHPEAIDPAVLSRIGTTIRIPLPGKEERKKILEILLGEYAPQVDLDALAQATEGFSGRDLKTLTTRAFRTAFTSGESRLTTELLLREASRLRYGWR